MAADTRQVSPDAVDVTVRIELAEAGRFDEIVSTLKAHGLTDALAHRRLCIVNGTARADCLAELRQVAGVASVREDGTYRPLAG